jgi:hypothetical protein
VPAKLEFFSNLRSRKPEAGEIKDRAVKECGFPGVSSYLLMGFATDAVAGPGGQIQDRTYVLRLNQPVSGNWRVGVYYYSRVEEISAAPPKIAVTTKISKDTSAIFVSSDYTRVDIDGGATHVSDGEIMLEYGEQLFAPDVKENGKRDSKNGC